MKLWVNERQGWRALNLGGCHPVGEGGAGCVYLDPGVPRQVVKIFKAGQAQVHRHKIAAMLDAPPDQQFHRHNGAEWVQIAWPQAAVVDQHGTPVGYTMPLVDFSASTQLDKLLQRQDRRAQRLQEAFQFRLYTARNIASLVTEVHRRNHYIIDMKPQNVRVYRDNGFVALLDCDGFSIKGRNDRYPATLRTPDYLCPEGFGQVATTLGEEQDRFALAVLVFQLLNNGLHPFQGIPNPHNFRELSSGLSERIAQGQYAYARNGSQLPHPLSLMQWLDDHTVAMFHRAFTTQQDRPSAKEWRNHLMALVSSLQQCANSRDHQHFAKGCGLCSLDRHQGRPTKPTTRRVVAPVFTTPPVQPRAIRPFANGPHMHTGGAVVLAHPVPRSNQWASHRLRTIPVAFAGVMVLAASIHYAVHPIMQRDAIAQNAVSASPVVATYARPSKLASHPVNVRRVSDINRW